MTAVLTHKVLATIGADSMAAIAPTAKKLWGRCPQVAPTGILLSFFETVKLVNFCMYRRLHGSTLLQSRLISWLTFCVLYTVAFSNFSWSILLCLFITYFSNSIFLFVSYFSGSFCFVTICAEMLRPWPRGQNFGLGLEAVASVSALALSIWPRPGLGLLVPLPSSHLFS